LFRSFDSNGRQHMLRLVGDDTAAVRTKLRATVCG
jgi:hypothetical protein